MDTIIEALTGVKDLHKRELERRRINHALKPYGLKVSWNSVGVPSEVMSLGGPALKEQAKGRGVTKKVLDTYLGNLTPVVTAPRKSSKSKVLSSKKVPSQVGATGKGQEVHKTPTEWSRAFNAAFQAAPEQRRRKAGRWASGLVKYHGKPVKTAVSIATKVVNEHADPTWDDVLAAAGIVKEAK